MNKYKVDLHNHTVLSPCGSLEMSPTNLIKKAKEKGIDVLGITDHNSTKHCKLAEEIGKEEGVFIMKGAEITSSEEIHCLAFFESSEMINDLQAFIEKNILKIKNIPEKSGYQVVVDKDEMILEEIEYSLISSLSLGIEEIGNWVKNNNGIFIPAHIKRPYYSLMSQLGFIPPNLPHDAFELSKNTSINDVRELFTNNIENKRFIRSSDAHYIESVASNYSEFVMKEISFEEIRKAIKGIEGRDIILK